MGVCDLIEEDGPMSGEGYYLEDALLAGRRGLGGLLVHCGTNKHIVSN